MPTDASPHIRADYPAPPESFGRAAALGARFPGLAGLPAPKRSHAPKRRPTPR